MSKKVVSAFTLLALLACMSGYPMPLFAATTVTGTLVFKFTITVDSPLPGVPQIYCTGIAAVNDTGSGAVITENATSINSSPSGSGVCSVTIHYSWSLASQSTDKNSPLVHHLHNESGHE